MANRTKAQKQRPYSLGFSALSLLVIGLLTSCTDDVARPLGPQLRAQVVPMSQEAHARAARSQVDSAANGRKSRDVLDDMLRIEAAAPGFAGLYIDKDGALVGRLVRPENEGKARAAIAQLIQRREKGIFNTLASIKAVRITHASYSLSELLAWQDALFPPLAPLDAFSALHVIIPLNKVRIGIVDTTGTAAVLDVARKLGIPDDAVTVEVLGRIRLLSGLRGTWRPTFGGIQIKADALTGEVYVCSLGFNVTNAAGTRYALTASHCDSEYRALKPPVSPPDTPFVGRVDGPFYQPGSLSSNLIANVRINPLFNLSHPNCVAPWECAWADVMAMEYPANVAAAKQVARTTCCVGQNNNAGPIEVVGQWPVSAIAQPIGGTVDKMGRTTGWTRGTIIAVCGPIKFGDFAHGIFYLVCSADVSGAYAQEGDSGGPVYIDPMNNTRAAVGILTGGSPGHMYYSPWSAIQSHLGQTLFPY